MKKPELYISTDVEANGPIPGPNSMLSFASAAMAVLGTTFKGTSTRKMPKDWFVAVPKHTHVALDDAIEQGKLFCNILAYQAVFRGSFGRSLKG